MSEWLPSAASSLESFQEAFDDPVRAARTLVFELDGDGIASIASIAIIGDLYLNVQDAWAQHEVADRAKQVQAEIGWTLHPDHGGLGYATEAVEALLRLCFVDLGLRRVTAGCFADNVPSWRLMERVGMRRETHARQDSLHRSGEWLDGMSYGMLADEWRARHATS